MACLRLLVIDILKNTTKGKCFRGHVDNGKIKQRWVVFEYC